MAQLGNADEPIRSSAADQLGLGPYAKSLAQFVSRCDTPMTVAIQGDWGTGKTSLMYMVEEHLVRAAPEGSILTLWFNTWQYAQFAAEDRLPNALLSSFLRQLAPGEDTRAASVLKLVTRLAKPVASSAVRALTGGAVELNELPLPGWDLDLAAEAERLRAAIHDLIAQKRKAGIDRIYVFVDDLDRVEPKRSVELLEVIKSFLDWEGCVFVIAIDYAVVRRGLKQRFGIDETDIGGRSFFDKLIQLPFTIPVARFDIERYVETLFGSMGIEVEAEDHSRFAALATHAVTANPRAIKRLLNSFQLLILVAKASEVDTDEDDPVTRRMMLRNLFAVVCLQVGFEPVYGWLASKGSQLTAEDLLALAGLQPAEQPDDLEEAVNALPTDRHRAFAAFAPIFLDVVEAPDRVDRQFDRAELAQLSQAITLSRVTSVKASDDEGEEELDVEFRWSNRRLLKGVQDRLTTESEGILHRAVEVNFYQQQGSEQGSLYIRYPRLKSVKLELWHEPHNLWVYVHGKRGFVEAVRLMRQSDLFPNAQLNADESEFHLLHLDLAANLSFDERQVVIEKQALPIFLQAAAFLDQQEI